MHAPQVTLPEELDRLHKMRTTALDQRPLHNPTSFVGQPQQLVPLVEGVRHRSFEIDIFARPQGVCGQQGVPVVGRGDRHGVQGGVGQQLAEIGVGPGQLPRLQPGQLLGQPGQERRVDITQRRHLDPGEPGESTGNLPPLVANPNDPHSDGSWGGAGDRVLTPRHNAGRDSRRHAGRLARTASQELATIQRRRRRLSHAARRPRRPDSHPEQRYPCIIPQFRGETKRP